MTQSPRRSFLDKVLFLGPLTCPWWFAYTFDNRARPWVHDPKQILGRFVRPGQTVVDIGCGLGFFSLGLAELVGPEGKVISIDLQQQMIDRARRRAERRGLAERIEFRTCRQDSLDYQGSADFVLAFWMVHEVADPDRFLAEIRAILKPGGNLLIAEPKVHVPASRFAATVERVKAAGYEVAEGPSIRFSRSIACKNSDS